MAKPTIVTRASKGSALTWTEGDTNLTNLQNATISVTDGTNTAVLDLNDTLTLTAGTNISLSVNASTDTVTINSTASGGDVVSDTSPQLGGDLDVNGHSIVSTSNGNISIVPNGTGKIQLTPTSGNIVLGAVDFPTSTPTTGQVLYAVNSSGQLGWTTPASGGDVVNDTSPQLGGNLDVNGYSITSANNGNIAISPNGTGNIQLTPASGQVIISSVNFPTSTPSTGQVLYAVNGTGQLGWTTPSSGGATTLDGLNDVVITAAATDDVLRFDGTNWVDTALSSITVGTAGVGSTVTLTADNTTNATNYPLFANAATGNLSPRTDTGFTYNPSTGILTSTGFSGALNGTVGATTPAEGSFTNITSTGLTTLKTYKETVYAGGSQTSAYTPNYNNGTVHTVTLGGNVTFAAPTNMSAGTSLTLILTQDATGSRTGTWNASYKFSGGTPTLTTTANAIDIVNIFYDGVNYLSSISKQDNSSTVTGLAINAQGELRLADSDSSNYVGFKSPATVSANKIWTLPSADGTSGQVLSTNGSGTLSWATAGGGNNIIVVGTASSSISFTNTVGAASTSNLTLYSSGGISGVSVSTNTFTIPAGSYVFKMPPCKSSNTTNYGDIILYNTTSSSTVISINNMVQMTMDGNLRGVQFGEFFYFTLASSGTLQFRNNSAVGSTPWTLTSWSSGVRWIVELIKVA